MTETNKRWYVVYVADQRRISALPTAIRTVSKDVAVWVPTQTIFHKVKSRLKEIVKPMFPCYVFLNTDVNASEMEDVVKTSCGGKFLRLPGCSEPTPLTDAEVKHLHHVVTEKGNAHSLVEQYDLSVDRTVEITNGPFLGTRGVIKDLRKEKVIVEVTIFGRNVLAEVDPASCLIVE